MITPTKIYVAGHRGMVGSAIIRHLQKYVIASEAQQSIQIITRTHADLDLTNQAAVQAFFAQEKPDQVYLAAAKVGGIHANNTYPAEFINPSLMIEANVIDSAFRAGGEKLLFLDSSCVQNKNFLSAHGGERAADGDARTHQRTLSQCQDRWHQTV